MTGPRPAMRKADPLFGFATEEAREREHELRTPDEKSLGLENSTRKKNVNKEKKGESKRQ